MYLIIDSSALGHAARFSTGGLMHGNKKTGVIFGFCKQILRISELFQTANIIFCWDGQDYLRKQIYPEYKHNRNKQQMTERERIEMEQAFIQFDLLHREVLPSFGFRNNFKIRGYEADDIIAYIVQEYDASFTVVSSDQDLYQLLDFCNMYLNKKQQVYTKDDFKEEYGIEPNLWSEVKAIAGCSTDAVPGLEGVGEKSVAQYFSGQLKMTSTKYAKIKDAINESKFDPDKSIVVRNRKLVELPMKGFPGVDLVSDIKIDISQFRNICTNFGFRSFLTGDIYDKWQNLFKLRG